MVVEILVPATQEQIDQLEEDREKLEHLLQLFKDWLRFQEHLNQDFNKNILVHFLRTSKLNLQKAKTRFENYCYLQRTYEVFFVNRIATLERDVQVLDSLYMVALPQLAPDGTRVCWCKANDPDKVDPLSAFRCGFLMCDYGMYNDSFVNGVTVVVDMTNVGAELYSKLFTPLSIKAARAGIGTYPCRIAKVFIISCHPILEKGYHILKHLLPEKIRNRISFSTKFDELSKYIPVKAMPSDYNGSEVSLSVLSNCWKKKLLESTELIKEIERLLPSGPIPKHIVVHDDTIGIQGSFRKLNID